VFTCKIEVDLGTGSFVNAPAGTNCDLDIVSDTGTSVFVPAGVDSCLTVLATGECTVTISSPTTGITVVKACTEETAPPGGLNVLGVLLSRCTTTLPAPPTSTNCTPSSPQSTFGPTDAVKCWADDTVRTDIYDTAHNVITTVSGPAAVHDKVFVDKAAGTPAAPGVPGPTGDVIFHRYATLDCTGASVDQTVTLAGGVAESSTFTAAADMSYRAEYLGDAIYPAHTGACEPLTVTGGGLITHTQVDCNDVLSGAAANAVIGQVNYSGTVTIGQGINPGKFFFWSKITTTVANQVVTVPE
jgi:hypothetical protein